MRQSCLTTFVAALKSRAWGSYSLVLEPIAPVAEVFQAGAIHLPKGTERVKLTLFVLNPL
ncbi:hypothetical protein [Laspinema olomoucense]|uniref:hypothetical protein n=1 Tax=Laspinema olomoucense TaxID=3231600 RepID=UPI0021BA8737|nr:MULTISPECIES: hypothetical protein [unclassified Laspinema]MCT7972834.1 hypothetical protein [Laspinema sp. D3d]MCT7991752.1 hypothetical protein [Laspinema sp. D3a]MCT7995628.1 hypothetical protein [Laspinema sp. D3c]